MCRRSPRSFAAVRVVHRPLLAMPQQKRHSRSVSLWNGGVRRVAVAPTGRRVALPAGRAELRICSPRVRTWVRLGLPGNCVGEIHVAIRVCAGLLVPPLGHVSPEPCSLARDSKRDEVAATQSASSQSTWPGWQPGMRRRIVSLALRLPNVRILHRRDDAPQRIVSSGPCAG